MRKSRRIVLLAALLFSFLCFPMDKVFAAANMAEVPLTVEQKFEVKNSKKEINLIGHYEFRALDENAPMPEKSEEEIYSFSMEGEQAEHRITLQYSHAGVYHYQLLQITEEKEHYQYDRSCYDIMVCVKNGEDGHLIPQVIAEKGDGKKYGDLQFQNSCLGEPQKPSRPVKPMNPGTPSKPVKTGDTTNVAVYFTLTMSALLLSVALLYRKKHYQKKQ